MVNDYDVLIVGAGILGLSCAYYLKRNNPKKSVLVVDRFADIAQGNTGRSNAMFRNTFTSKDNRILCDSSIDFYLDAQAGGRDLGLEKIGYLWVMDDAQLEKNEKHVRTMLDSGIDLKTLDRADLKRLLPSMTTEFGRDDDEARLLRLRDVAGAVFGVKCGRLDPAKLARFYSDEFLSSGGRIVFNVEVKRLIAEAAEPLGIEGEPFVWQEGRVAGMEARGGLEGEVRAGKVVIATGVWNNELLEPVGIDGHVKAKKRQLFTIPAGSDPALRNLMYNKKFNSVGVIPYIILPKSGCYVKAVQENNEFWIGCEDDFNRPYIDLPERTLDDLRAEPHYYQQSVYPILRKYFPQFENVKPAQMWAGYYSMNTVDSMPFVFEEDGMIVAGGGSGSGIMKADSMGRIVDAVYRAGEEAEVELYGGRVYPAWKIGFKHRGVEREEWVI